MVRMTSGAIAHIDRVRRTHQVSADETPRLAARGAQVTLAFTSRPERSDRAYVADRHLVYVADDIARRLDRATIDVRPDGDQTILVIREPSSVGQPRGAVH